MAGVGTLVLNTWDSWVEQDAAGVFLHGLFPLLLIGLSEAVGYYRRRCGEVAADLRSQLAAIAGQAADETRELERLTAAREAAEAQARADQAAADRARAELAAEVQRTARGRGVRAGVQPGGLRPGGQAGGQRGPPPGGQGPARAGVR